MPSVPPEVLTFEHKPGMAGFTRWSSGGEAGQRAVRAADRLAEAAQDRDLAVERGDPLVHELLGRAALAGADRPAEREPRQRLDLLQPEAEVLQGQRGLDVGPVLAGVLPGAARRPPRFRQDAELLVVPDGPAADPGIPGQLTDAQQPRGVRRDLRHDRSPPRPPWYRGPNARPTCAGPLSPAFLPPCGPGGAARARALSGLGAQPCARTPSSRPPVPGLLRPGAISGAQGPGVLWVSHREPRCLFSARSLSVTNNTDSSRGRSRAGKNWLVRGHRTVNRGREPGRSRVYGRQPNWAVTSYQDRA